MTDKYVIEQVLCTPEGDELLSFGVAGATLAQAIMASMLMAAPHIQGGILPRVTAVGLKCEDCGNYHAIDVNLRPTEEHNHDSERDLRFN